MKTPVVLGLFSLLGVAQAACDASTFMPVGTRTYALNSGADKSSISIKTSALSGDRMKVQTTMNGKTIPVVWTCTASGMKASIPAGQGGGQVNVDAGFFPPASRWKVGYSWNSAGAVDMDAPGLGAMKMTTATTSKIVKEEKITVPAGTFTALRVDSTISMKVSLPAGTKLPRGMDLNRMMGGPTTTSAWYVRGVGLIRSSSGKDGAGMVLTEMGK
ncbi:TapB family protein [Deinococcus arenicola]|uniref:DUF3108 domain-containing protein n=1 Tax=Deinococcus arenicola TaxID=2994950 RepID=A0ABU4DUR7_9DEIO|nr:hypothetical protein [Deinococcus sp. ZS9-10]MDV6376151.1 hypothetical protein [Deinococcus sp. ZS9-10]